MDAREKLNAAVKIESFIRQGYEKSTISKKMTPFSEELFSIAKARIKNARDEKVNQSFIFTEDDLRFCTNQLVADYRAKRLKCKTLVDIGCGIGVQAISFAKECGKVIAVDADARKIEYAKFNAEIAGLKNITFVNEDAITFLGKLSEADAIFWDPERPSSEAERSLDSFNPPFDKLIEKAKKVTNNIAVEVPPQMDRSKVGKDCEFEYVSVDGHLNRLTMYFGNLAKCKTCVVALPSNERLEYDGGKIPKLRQAKDFMNFLFEVDDAVFKAGLFEYFLSTEKEAYHISISEKDYVTSDKVLASSFLKPYKLLSLVKVSELNEFLKDENFGKVILHGKIDDKVYGDLRAKIQFGLKGDKTAHVFLGSTNALVAVKL